MWPVVLCVLACAYGGGGVTKTSGISKFWTDDYKVFEQIYGKTSDKDLYGPMLPPNVGYGIENSKKKPSASEKKETYLENSDLSDFETNLADRYAKLYTAQTLDNYEKVFKPATSSFNFVSYSDFKPITQQNDPETYNYLKHLEQLDQEQNLHFPGVVGGFKPYLSNADIKPEDTQAYKSIQDILDAHENNKLKENKENVEKDEDEMKYLNYGRIKSRKKTNPRMVQNNYVSKPRCRSGRCRKRSANSVRVRSRPYVRKIQRIVGY